MRVAEASDNAAYWSIATTMRSDNKANSVIQDALGLGAAKVDTAYTAMNSSINVVDQIKQKVLLAKTSSDDDRAKIQTEIATLQAQLKDNIAGANYAGSNLLKTSPTGSETKLSVMTSYNRDSTGKVTTGTVDVDFSKTRLIDADAVAADPSATPPVVGVAGTGILDTAFVVDAATTPTKKSILDLDVSAAGVDFDKMLKGVEDGLKNMATGAAELGAAKSRIDMQKDFVSKLSDSIERGVGQLVDADMNKESTRLQALQVQQQLGIQALSIANGNAQSILSLFRG
ncbi:flagellin [Mesorhizobium soli]|uniref:flagellin n=1 Tax=Pseudaminobacter soli (ex Li et al. 2025) TaxID=1295366 RepID=UPI00247E640A|nr:flagellin [Mesorhizobium soli]